MAASEAPRPRRAGSPSSRSALCGEHPLGPSADLRGLDPPLRLPQRSAETDALSAALTVRTVKAPGRDRRSRRRRCPARRGLWRGDDWTDGPGQVISGEQSRQSPRPGRGPVRPPSHPSCKVCQETGVHVYETGHPSQRRTAHARAPAPGVKFHSAASQRSAEVPPLTHGLGSNASARDRAG